MSDSMKLQIWEKANQLFKENGYNNVSIMNICKACNISKTTFYYHYQSKHDLIIHYFDKTHYGTEEILKLVIAQNSVAEQIWSITRLYFQAAMDAGVSMTREIYREYLYDKNSPVIPDNVYLKNLIIDLIRKGISNKEFSGYKSIDDLYITLMSISNGLTLQWIMQDGDFDLVEKAEKIILHAINR